MKGGAAGHHRPKGEQGDSGNLLLTNRVGKKGGKGCKKRAKITRCRGGVLQKTASRAR